MLLTLGRKTWWRGHRPKDDLAARGHEKAYHHGRSSFLSPSLMEPGMGGGRNHPIVFNVDTNRRAKRGSFINFQLLPSFQYHER